MTDNSAQDACFLPLQREGGRPGRFFLLTLAHAEVPGEVDRRSFDRVAASLKCSRVLISQEEHREGGRHFHICIHCQPTEFVVALDAFRRRMPEKGGSRASLDRSTSLPLA
jgi:hypothetical protein